jgi:DNA-binding transcriptional LysR family regulator
MSASEWLRTFVAIYRSGSVSGGASQRNLSQPAASQQLAALERRIGLPLFIRTPRGVEPTRQGQELHARVAESLDRLEDVLVGLDGGPVAADPAIRFGSSAEFFAFAVLPRFNSDAPALTARFGPDDQILDLLEHGEVDVAVTSITPGRRSLTSTPIGTKRFVLVGPPALAPALPFESPERLGSWLSGKPWVAFSAELPLTRRFWQSAFGHPFDADLRLVAPDLRVVAAAVADGLGISLLPTFVCRDALTLGSVVELHPVTDSMPIEPWFACTRVADLSRAPLHRLISDLSHLEDGQPAE